MTTTAALLCRWVNLMGILKVMSTKAPDVHAGIKRYLAESTM